MHQDPKCTAVTQKGSMIAQRIQESGLKNHPKSSPICAPGVLTNPGKMWVNVIDGFLEAKY
jgi:hypothetical protein